MTSLISKNKLLFHGVINLAVSSGMIALKSYCGGYIEGVCFKVGIMLNFPAFYLLALVTGVNYTMHFVPQIVFTVVSFILYVSIIATFQYISIKLLNQLPHRRRPLTTPGPQRHFAIPKTITLIPVIVISLIFGITIYACFPRVEEVTFTAYNNRFKNHLGIKINTTKLAWFQGPDGFINISSDYYSITLLIKNTTCNARDIDIIIHGKNEITLTPADGTVTIDEQNPKNMTIRVSLNDERIPKLLNRIYMLKAKESSAEYITYTAN